MEGGIGKSIISHLQEFIERPYKCFILIYVPAHQTRMLAAFMASTFQLKLQCKQPFLGYI